MAARQKLYVSLSAFLFIGLLSNVSATIFILRNSCSYTIWPGILSDNGAAILGDGGFPLASGATIHLPAPPGWSGRFWARTGCNFDDAGNGQCTTGDCGGTIKCRGGGAPPVSLVKFTIGSGGAAKDFYDVSLFDGYNVGLGVRPSGGTGNCKYAGFLTDLNEICPKELQVVGDDGSVVACKSACAAFNSSEYCCNGDHATRQTCMPMDYSQIFKKACPSYEDLSSTCTCAASDYLITFCYTN